MSSCSAWSHGWHPPTWPVRRVFVCLCHSHHWHTPPWQHSLFWQNISHHTKVKAINNFWIWVGTPSRTPPWLDSDGYGAVEKVKYRQLSVLLINVAHSTEDVCQRLFGREWRRDNTAPIVFWLPCFQRQQNCASWSAVRGFKHAAAHSDGSSSHI